MERNFHELQPYYYNPDIIVEIEDLSFCVTYILKKLKTQKDNLENSKYELRVEDIRFQTHFLDDISEDIRFEKQCVDDIRKLREEIAYERLRVEDITFGKMRVEDIRFENYCVDNISKEERDVEIVDTTEEHDLVVAGNRSTANQGPWILEETKRAKEEIKAGTSSMNEGTISKEAIEGLDNDFEQAIITTTGREDFKGYFIPRESPHFGGSRVDGCFVTDATMNLEPPDERQNVEMAIKDADDRSMTVEDAVLNPKAKKKKPMACLPIKHIEQLPKEKCSEEENTKVQKKKRHIKGKSSSTGKLTTSSRNLWVSGLSSLTRASDLKGIFFKYGKVIGAKVVTNTRTPGTRCYSYVTMSSSSDASRSVAKRRVDTTKKYEDKKIRYTTSKTRDDKCKTIDTKDDASKKPEVEKDKQRDKEKSAGYCCNEVAEIVMSKLIQHRKEHSHRERHLVGEHDTITN
ncbi:scaffold attachment factor B1-like [Bactrocera neohumeralis]|uniref:scaffold attachment factor B1-like n=1 Tax=Bactrocera neohumeralis TaxID=98809 RepID=UPI0021654D20|nr:scaffold attachment factor B1-like [Bactrocera neohumeralis]